MRTRLLLGLLLVALAASAAAETPRFETDATAHVALLEPRAGTVLRGGELAVITWTATRAFEAEEWEAFLSVDGGRYYSARLTPHLDIGLRSFTFVVPNIGTNDARLLIRTGDERDETIVEFAQRFSIRASAKVDDRIPRATFGAAEAARPGDEPVIEWSAGPRSGIGSEVARSTRNARTIARAITDSEACVSAALPNSQTVASVYAPRHAAPRPHSRTFAVALIPIARDAFPLLHRLNI